jgi:hypothetical protein
MKKIGWQKYEDMLTTQLTCPFSSLIATNQMIASFNEESEEDEEIEQAEQNDFLSMIQDEEKEVLVIPVPASIHEQIALMSNYDCWIGHSNFNLTDDIRIKLKKAPGVEISKVYGRYRFFLGVGKMFDFGEVRQSIEELLL